MALGREPGAGRVGTSDHCHHGQPRSSGYIQLQLHNSVRVLIRMLGSSHASVFFFSSGLVFKKIFFFWCVFSMYSR